MKNIVKTATLEASPTNTIFAEGINSLSEAAITELLGPKDPLQKFGDNNKVKITITLEEID